MYNDTSLYGWEQNHSLLCYTVTKPYKMDAWIDSSGWGDDNWCILYRQWALPIRMSPDSRTQINGHVGLHCSSLLWLLGPLPQLLLALPHFVVVYVRLPRCKHSKSTSMPAGCLDRQLATRQLINWSIHNTTGCKRDAATGQQPRQWRQTTHHRSLHVSFDHKNVRCSSIADYNSKMMPLLLTKSTLFTLTLAVQSPAYSDVCVNDK